MKSLTISANNMFICVKLSDYVLFFFTTRIAVTENLFVERQRIVLHDAKLLRQGFRCRTEVKQFANKTIFLFRWVIYAHNTIYCSDDKQSWL